MTRHMYKIKVIGSFGPATHEAFADMVVEVEPTSTVLSGNLDQRGLHAVLAVPQQGSPDPADQPDPDWRGLFGRSDRLSRLLEFPPVPESTTGPHAGGRVASRRAFQ